MNDRGCSKIVRRSPYTNFTILRALLAGQQAHKARKVLLIRILLVYSRMYAITLIRRQHDQQQPATQSPSRPV